MSDEEMENVLKSTERVDQALKDPKNSALLEKYNEKQKKDRYDALKGNWEKFFAPRTSNDRRVQNAIDNLSKDRKMHPLEMAANKEVLD